MCYYKKLWLKNYKKCITSKVKIIFLLQKPVQKCLTGAIYFSSYKVDIKWAAAAITKAYFKIFSFTAAFPERKTIVLVKSYEEVQYQTDGPPNTKKRSFLFFSVI